MGARYLYDSPNTNFTKKKIILHKKAYFRDYGIFNMLENI
jgi:hypothetical protein